MQLHECNRWAARAMRSVSSSAGSVLNALLSFAGTNRLHVWPSQKTIADICGMSIRHVRRALAELEKAGLICPGDPSHVASFRPDRRPKVWQILATPIDSRDTSDGGQIARLDFAESKSSACGRTEPGGTGGQNRVERADMMMSDKEPSIKQPSMNPVVAEISNPTTGVDNGSRKELCLLLDGWNLKESVRHPLLRHIDTFMRTNIAFQHIRNGLMEWLSRWQAGYARNPGLLPLLVDDSINGTLEIFDPLHAAPAHNTPKTAATAPQTKELPQMTPTPTPTPENASNGKIEPISETVDTKKHVKHFLNTVHTIDRRAINTCDGSTHTDWENTISAYFRAYPHRAAALPRFAQELAHWARTNSTSRPITPSQATELLTATHHTQLRLKATQQAITPDNEPPASPEYRQKMMEQIRASLRRAHA